MSAAASARKIYHYAEEAIVTWAAGKLKQAGEMDRRALRELHVATRMAATMSSTAEMALDAEGKFLGLRITTLANMGAYLSTFAPCVPTYLYATLLAGVYTTPVIYCEVKAVFTNTVPVDAYRGAGRPEATFLLERLVDVIAHDTGIDRVEIRRQELHPGRRLPLPDAGRAAIRQRRLPDHAEGRLANADWAGFEARRAEAKKRGKLRGIGISTYLEACGIAPSAVVGSLGARAGLYEVAEIRVHPTGSVTVFTGTHSHGQGHETTLAQLVVRPARRAVRPGRGRPRRHRQDPVRHGHLRQPQPRGRRFGDGQGDGQDHRQGQEDRRPPDGSRGRGHRVRRTTRSRVAGTDKSKTLTDISLAAYVPHNYPIEELEPGLDETAFYDPKNFTFPGGCHIAEVEIDPETGVVEMVNFTAVDDVGRVINPMIVEGQVQGGVAQGIGQALLENAVYDAGGQLLSGLATWTTRCRAANDMPNMSVATENTMCTHNPLGSKGCGEVGAIGSPPAVINAVVDALKDYGVRHLDMPATRTKDLVHHPGRSAAHGGRVTQAKGNRTMYDFAYQKPGSLADAVKMLAGDADAKALAGGQTFIPVLKQRLNKPTTVVDLSKLGLTGITVSGNTITIGAMTRHCDIATNADIKAKIPASRIRRRLIGDEAVRHRGTMGGSLANNDPAA